MKTLPQTPTLGAEDIVSTPLPLKACMHVAAPARFDFRVMRDARVLIEAGFEVTIVDIESDPSRPSEEVIDGICLKHVAVPGWFTPVRFKPFFLVKYTMMFIASLISLLRNKADLYHAHVEKALPACYIVARLRRKPLIFDAPDLTLSDPRLLRWPRLRRFSIRLLAHMVSRCTAVITASPFYIPTLRTLYHPQDVVVIRNVPTYRSIARGNRLREHLGLGPEVRIALYQGNIQMNRGLDKLVRAAKFIEQDIVIVMMGRTVEPAISELKALIASEQVAERVKLLPAMPYEELLDWTASADIGLTIFPPDYSLSIRFTLPNKLFEYLMAGLPVLSAQLDAIAEVIETYDVGKIAPSLAPSDLGAAINDLLADTAALARMRENALKIVQREFHWESESQKLIQLYRTLLSKS